ncbi:Protein WVD2-like 7 [Cardamine amara subsp. amara]|uniref:Protein WVD2-like 7 n=1 Tax=Cardamine amara subsp. amara TaxID=228776 RepID=A0ABD0ZZ72_CARAN
MGESICLVRSFSQPAEFSSRETFEVVPHRVLTESVSFGRFANETLAWEKWSAFTQNRYLEEVERFTKPGSVAEKKAFFEAHFKNRAAGKVTQTKKIEEVKVKTCDEVVCDIPKDILVDSEVPLVVNNGMAKNEIRHDEVDSIAPSVSVMDETTDVQIGEVENLDSVAVPEDEVLDEEKSASLSKERPPSSSGSKACSRSSKMEPTFAIGLDHSLKNTRKESSSSSKRSSSVSKNRSRSPPEPFHMSTSCAPSGNTDKAIVGMPQKGSRRSTTNGKGVGKADEKKISGPSSVHMSLNFASSARKTTKRSHKKLARNSTTKETTSSNERNSVFSNGNEPTEASQSRKRPLPRTSKEGSKAAKCSTNASAVRLPKLPPKNQLSENKRINISVGSSVSCRIPNNVQRKPSVGIENLPTHSRTKTKSFTVSSPFVFRSEERAQKRKEFFTKVEEKNKKEDTGKDKLSCGLKANQNTHLVSEEHKKPQVGGFQVHQISLTSPRFRRNQTPGKENINKSHRSPHKVSPIKIINIKKAVMEKYKSCKIHPSSKSQTKKQTQENSSPNILQQ